MKKSKRCVFIYSASMAGAFTVVLLWCLISKPDVNLISLQYSVKHLTGLHLPVYAALLVMFSILYSIGFSIAFTAFSFINKFK